MLTLAMVLVTQVAVQALPEPIHFGPRFLSRFLTRLLANAVAVGWLLLVGGMLTIALAAGIYGLVVNSG